MSQLKSTVASELPDLSYLNEEERRVIEAVLERQRLEEEKNQIQNKIKAPLKVNKINNDNSNNFERATSIQEIAKESKQKYGLNIDTGQVCDLCKKTKFSSGIGHECQMCKLKCCIKCAVMFKKQAKLKLLTNSNLKKLIWHCKLCLNSQKYSIKSSDKVSLNKNYVSDYVLDKTNDDITTNILNSQIKQQLNDNNNNSNFQRKSIKKQQSLHEQGTNSNEFNNSNMYLANNSCNNLQSLDLNRQQSSERLNEPQNLFKNYTNSTSESINLIINNDNNNNQDYENNKNHSHELESIMNNNNNNNIQIINKRHVKLQIQHADSLSSDPSEHNTNESYSNLNESTTNLSSKKHDPTLITNNSNHTNSSLKKTKLSKKHKNKQYSLSSDDEDEEYPEEEIFSTEYTTGDENDLERANRLHEQQQHNQSPLHERYINTNTHNLSPKNSDNKINESNVKWKVAPGGRKLIGNICLNRLDSNGNLISVGLKVLGGQMSSNGILSTFIVKIRKDSLAESVGRLKIGDELIEWNYNSLRGLSNEQVQELLLNSKYDECVVLIVERNLFTKNPPISSPPPATSNISTTRKRQLPQLPNSHNLIREQRNVSPIKVDLIRKEMSKKFYASEPENLFEKDPHGSYHPSGAYLPKKLQRESIYASIPFKLTDKTGLSMNHIKPKVPTFKRTSKKDTYDSDGSEHSQFSTMSKLSSVSMISTKSEIVRESKYKEAMKLKHLKDKDKNQTSIESSSKETQKENTETKAKNSYSDKKDGTLSDSALTNHHTTSSNTKPSMGKALVILGLSKKNNNKRLGFARSEEIGISPELKHLSSKSVDNTNENEVREPLNDSKKQNLWSGALKLPHEQPFSKFVESLGPGQTVGRQVLGSPCLGEVQMSICIDKNQLAIEIIRAKNLKLKPGHRILPAAYVKLYLFDGATCIEKQKTAIARRTLDPMYQEVLRFNEQNFYDKLLQITVWGDYGKLDRKVFMGVAQVLLGELDLTSLVIGWYKLYSLSSLMTDFISNSKSTEIPKKGSASDAYNLNAKNSSKLLNKL